MVPQPGSDVAVSYEDRAYRAVAAYEQAAGGEGFTSNQRMLLERFIVSQITEAIGYDRTLRVENKAEFQRRIQEMSV